MKIESANLPALHQDYLVAFFDNPGSSRSMADYPWREHCLTNPELFTPSKGATLTSTCGICRDQRAGNRRPAPPAIVTWDYVPLPPSIMALDRRSNRLGYLVGACAHCKTVGYIAIDRQTARASTP